MIVSFWLPLFFSKEKSYQVKNAGNALFFFYKNGFNIHPRIKVPLYYEVLGYDNGQVFHNLKEISISKYVGVSYQKKETNHQK